MEREASALRPGLQVLLLIRPTTVPPRSRTCPPRARRIPSDLKYLDLFHCPKRRLPHPKRVTRQQHDLGTREIAKAPVELKHDEVGEVEIMCLEGSRAQVVRGVSRVPNECGSEVDGEARGSERVGKWSWVRRVVGKPRVGTQEVAMLQAVRSEMANLREDLLAARYQTESALVALLQEDNTEAVVRHLLEAQRAIEEAGRKTRLPEEIFLQRLPRLAAAKIFKSGP